MFKYIDHDHIFETMPDGSRECFECGYKEPRKVVKKRMPKKGGKKVGKKGC